MVFAHLRLGGETTFDTQHLLRTPSTFTQKESESDEEANFDEEKFVSDLREKGGLLEQKVKSMNDFVKKMERKLVQQQPRPHGLLYFQP